MIRPAVETCAWCPEIATVERVIGTLHGPRTEPFCDECSDQISRIEREKDAERGRG